MAPMWGHDDPQVRPIRATFVGELTVAVLLIVAVWALIQVWSG